MKKGSKKHQMVIKSLYDNIASNSFNEPFDVNPKFMKKWGWPTILIVDDQYINRFIINQFCNKFDIACVTAEDGQQAVEIIKHECTKRCCRGIELILMDLNMPVLDGIEATKQIVQFIKEFKIAKELSIVAVTAFPSESEKIKWIKAGMQDYYIKPFTINNFKSLIS